jgi:hypothetical protein
MLILCTPRPRKCQRKTSVLFSLLAFLLVFPRQMLVKAEPAPPSEQRKVLQRVARTLPWPQIHKLCRDISRDGRGLDFFSRLNGLPPTQCAECLLLRKAFVTSCKPKRGMAAPPKSFEPSVLTISSAQELFESLQQVPFSSLKNTLAFLQNDVTQGRGSSERDNGYFLILSMLFKEERVSDDPLVDSNDKGAESKALAESLFE